MSLFQFGDFELNEQTLELRKNGRQAKIQQQPARVLAFLLNHRGALVTRDQIRLAIWGNETFVDFKRGLNFCIRQIRIALNDEVQNPTYIETLPRLGYRFIAGIKTVPYGEALETRKPLRVGIVPFDDLSRTSEDYFGVGLTEDVISALSRIDPLRLRVTAIPKSVANDSLGGELGRLKREVDLDYLLRGSVRRSASKIRITAQLHDLRDFSILWSDTLDRESADLLAVQEEVARRVTQSLAVELFPSATVGARRYSRSSAAYDAYLRGRFLWHKMTPDSIRRSMDYFNEALSIDARFAPAHAGLADCFAQMGSIRVGLMKPLEAVEHARSHLMRALDLDETLAEAHCTLGLIKIWYDFDWSGAEREFQVAIALDPSQITPLIWQSLLLQVTGRHEESIEATRRALEMEPFSLTANTYYALALANSGREDLGIRHFQKCIELEPGYYRPHMFLGKVLCWLKRYEEAAVSLRKAVELEPAVPENLAYLASVLAGLGDRAGAFELLKQLQPAEERTEPAIVIAPVYAQLGMVNEMFSTLEKAVETKSNPIYLLVLNRELAPYRNDPRFKKLLASVGLTGKLPIRFRGECSD